MTQIALLHSHLGVRAGVHDAAIRLRDAGHEVLVVDYNDGRVFDDHEQASIFTEEVGFPELMRRALTACEALDDGFVAMGFSNGAGMAEYVALHRPVARVVLASGTLPLEMLGADAWPTGVPAQIHYTIDDPFRSQPWLDAVAAAIRETATLELYDDYPGGGHLFTDQSLPGEYHAEAAGLFWPRVLSFCADRGA